MTTRIAVLTTLLVASLVTATATAQPKTPPRAVEAAAPAGDERTARDTRERLREVLEQYPPSVAQVLRLDPSLLIKQDYIATYPTLAAFLAQHPEVAHNPVFYLGGAGGPPYPEFRSRAASAVQNVLLGLEFMFGFMAAGVGLWFAKNGVIDEVAQPLYVVSILAIALGVGFVLSALASYALSRQLGLVDAPSPHA